MALTYGSCTPSSALSIEDESNPAVHHQVPLTPMSELITSRYWYAAEETRRARLHLPESMLIGSATFDFDDDDHVETVELVEAYDDVYEW